VSDEVRTLHDLCAELLRGAEDDTKGDEKRTGAGELLALCKPDAKVDAKARAMLAVFVWHCPQVRLLAPPECLLAPQEYLLSPQDGLLAPLDELLAHALPVAERGAPRVGGRRRQEQKRTA